MLYLKESSKGLGWSVGPEKGRKDIKAYRIGKSVYVDVETHWGVVQFKCTYAKHCWGPWKDTRPGRSARRYADKYLPAEFLETLRYLHDDVSEALAQAYILRGEIVGEERGRLDESVIFYNKIIKKHISRIRKMGWKRISIEWLGRLAIKSKPKDVPPSDAEQALAFALDELTFRGVEIYSLNV